MSENCEKIIMEIVEMALKLETGALQSDSDSDSIAEWDSLGHLGVLVALDKHFNGSVSSISKMADANSIQAISAALKEHGLC